MVQLRDSQAAGIADDQLKALLADVKDPLSAWLDSKVPVL